MLLSKHIQTFFYPILHQSILVVNNDNKREKIYQEITSDFLC